MKLTEGMTFPNFTVNTSKEDSVDLYSRIDRKTVFWVIRYIGCTVCRYDVHVLAENYDRIREKGCQLFVVMQSDTDHVRRELKDANIPFEIICDNEFRIYNELEINPEKIGTIGFSAGGHLSVIAATNSQTNYYTPVDALDQVPCHLNFAIAVYPAYVLEDGAEGENARRGIDEKILPAFKFDAKTPPMCLVHGDADVYSPLGSVAIYTELHRRNIPVELHIYTESGHGLGNQKWEERIWDWLKRKYYPSN